MRRRSVGAARSTGQAGKVGEVLILANVSRGNTGGGWPHVRGLAQGLRESGSEYSLMCVGDGDGADDPEFKRIIERRPPQRPIVWRLGSFGSLSYWREQIRDVASGCAGVVALSAGMAVAAKQANCCPVIYAPAIISAVEHPNWWLEKRVEQRAFHRVDGVLLTTQSVCAVVDVIFGRPASPLKIASLGIDRGKLDGETNPRMTWGIPPEARVLLTVGKINENKGQHLIAQALGRAGCEDWWWVLLGDGPDRDALEQWVKASQLHGRVIFAGHAGTLGSWYKHAQVLVAASRHETFGLAIAEALACGLPVVIPRNEPPAVLSPLADAVERRGLGAVFSRGEALELSAAIEAVLRCGDISDRARQWADETLDWTAYASAALELLALADQHTRTSSHREMATSSR
jgi:glycosyltransferase involved in cell wall biosynthesis